MMANYIWAALATINAIWVIIAYLYIPYRKRKVKSEIDVFTNIYRYGDKYVVRVNYDDNMKEFYFVSIGKAKVFEKDIKQMLLTYKHVSINKLKI